jgi:hypothetical protein
MENDKHKELRLTVHLDSGILQCPFSSLHSPFSQPVWFLPRQNVGSGLVLQEVTEPEQLR